MTPTQKLEVKRLTRAMWDTLREVERYKVVYAPKTTGRILARRGLIEMAQRPDAEGLYSATVTEAGIEALEYAKTRKEQR